MCHIWKWSPVQGCPFHARALNSNMHVFQPLLSTTVRLHHCLQVTNVGLVEFTPGHAPSVQLVATLLMTSPPRAPIGPETSRTCPIACRWSDVSGDRSRSLSVEWAWRRDYRRQCQRDATPWLAEKAVKVNVCCWEKTGEGESGTDASAAPHKLSCADENF